MGNRKIYRYDNKSLTYKEIDLRLLKTILISIICFISFAAYFYEPIDKIYEDEIVVLIDKDKFTEKRLVEHLKKLNVKYPEIVYAQAKLETGYFKSKFFLENNNLFGMKLAYIRPTVAKGQKDGHAFYDDWQDSVVDYALYQSYYLRDVKTKEQYLSYLKQYYAADSLYIDKLKKIITPIKITI